MIKKYVYPDVSDKMDAHTIVVLLSIAVVATCLCYPLYLLSEKHTYRMKTYVKQFIKKE